MYWRYEVFLSSDLSFLQKKCLERVFLNSFFIERSHYKECGSHELNHRDGELISKKEFIWAWIVMETIDGIYTGRPGLLWNLFHGFYVRELHQRGGESELQHWGFNVLASVSYFLEHTIIFLILSNRNQLYSEYMNTHKAMLPTIPELLWLELLQVNDVS